MSVEQSQQTRSLTAALPLRSEVLQQTTQPSRFSLICSALFLIAFGVSLWEITARYMFNSPTIWAHESVIALVALGYLMGGIQVFIQRQHIGICLLAGTDDERSRARLQLFSTLVVTLFFAGGIAATLPTAVSAWVTPSGYWRIEGTGSAWNPPTPALVKSALLLTFLTLFAFACYQLWQDSKSYIAWGSSASGEPKREPVWPALLIALTIVVGGALGFLGPVAQHLRQGDQTGRVPTACAMVAANGEWVTKGYDGTLGSKVKDSCRPWH